VRPLLALLIGLRGALKALAAAVGPATYARSHRR
jgi:hypothetical protein